MKKRKISGEKNSGYIELLARPSVTSLRTTSEKRRSRSAKSPSVQNLHNPNSSDKFLKFEDNRATLPNEMQPPKTRFGSQGRSKDARSTSSPRLKSFPAEKIKKLDNPPMFLPEPIVRQDSRENGNFLTSSSARNNNGHGDAIPTQMLPYQQSKPQNISDASQQQFLDNNQQIYQTNPPFESMPIQQVASLERQTHHHSFVPNVSQDAVASDRSSQIPSAIINQPVIIPTSPTHATIVQAKQASSDSHAIIDQNRNETFERDIQPLGGRSAVNHKQIQMQQQPSIVQDLNAPLIDQFANNHQNAYHIQSHGQCQQNPRCINEPTQHDAHRQQKLLQPPDQMPTVSLQQQYAHDNSRTYRGNYNREISAMVNAEQGMTSPQDITMNQMRLQHLPIYHQKFEYPVNLQPWPRYGRWMQTANQTQQHLPQHSMPQWQYYYQTPDSNCHQQNSKSQDRSSSSKNLSQIDYRSTNQQSTAETRDQQGGGKKILQFTPDMIRDQEMLVSTMRQQRVPTEVMRRQFDGLLNEQRRQLSYVAQFQRQEADISEIKKIQLTRRRTERDEKPEWMVHITPPWISYSEIDRTRAQQRDSKEQCPMDDKSEINKITIDQQQNYMQQKKGEFTNQVIPSQMYVQMNPLCQQQANPSYKNDHQASCDYTNYYPYTHQQNAPNNLYQSNVNFNEYTKHPHAIRYDPYYSRWNPTPVDSAHLYERNGRQIEPSSLLKMRMYKEVIRPQKCNNGLQDPDNIQKILETLKNPMNKKKGLEYLANLSAKKPIVRLNGIQDPGKIPEDMQSRPLVEIPTQSRRGIQANGLANSRNVNNPPPRVLRPKRADEAPMMEYPRQRQNARNYGNTRLAEKENDMLANSRQRGYATELSHPQGARSIPDEQQQSSLTQGRRDDNVSAFQYEAVPLSQQYHLNGHNGGQGDVANMQRPDAPSAMTIDRAGGDTGEKMCAEETTKRTNGIQGIQRANGGRPEICEARTIGGITYLVRKPEYAFNNPVVSPDKLIASKHLQPPRIC